ncbi:hypothetical protein SJ05684_c18110 [Sinorhizobium sojae CCBAU 05684]|uniref:Uncharacterized protein n=1 Tax=Sinorhizobium sojae CCBAU 05684 TaxID=716928 RepID=A0A249PBF8_9HYPH|nr:hypothetical protein SJ05684_c18110 [Sinorhizobium sojae CCBAU 05684]
MTVGQKMTKRKTPAFIRGGNGVIISKTMIYREGCRWLLN